MDFDRKITELDVNDILPNRFQPRIKFNEESINELCDSIREHGVIQPIVVRKMGDKYEIIAGERRFKASLLAGKNVIPAVITELNDKDSAEIALIENVQRKDLTPIEEAISYKKILDMGYLTQEDLALKLGKTQSTVANKLRLLNLSEEVQEALLEEKISERHARSLLRLPTARLQIDMLNKIVMDRLTVRKTDDEIARILKGEKQKTEQELKDNIIPYMDNNNVNYMVNPNFEIELPTDKSSDNQINNYISNSIENNNSLPSLGNVDPNNIDFSTDTREPVFNELSFETKNDNQELNGTSLDQNNSFIFNNKENNYVPYYEGEKYENSEIVPSFEGSEPTIIPEFKINESINEELKYEEPVIIIEEEPEMNNNQYNNYQNNYNQQFDNQTSNQKEFNPFDMANNSVNNDYNIPTTPIEESPQMGNPFQQTNNDFVNIGNTTGVNSGIEEPQINVPTLDNSINPGFMDIDKIQNEAVDINALQTSEYSLTDNSSQNIGMDFGIRPMDNNTSNNSNNLDFGLFSSDDNILRPVTAPLNSQINEEVELQPGKFFHLPMEEEEDKNQEVRLDTNPFEFNINGDPSNLSLNMDDQPKLKSLDEISQFSEQPTLAENSYVQPMMNQVSNNFNDNPVNQFGFTQMEQQKQPTNNEFNFSSGIQVQPTQTQIPPMQQQQNGFGMMQQTNMQHSKDINAAMNAIKECVFKIKSLGFNVNTEDFDFENMYQIMFRIEK